MRILRCFLMFLMLFFISIANAETNQMHTKEYTFKIFCTYDKSKNKFSLSIVEYNPKQKKYEIIKSGIDIKVVGFGLDDKIIYEKRLNFTSKEETDAIFEKYEGGLLSDSDNSENRDAQTFKFFFETKEKLKKIQLFYFERLVLENTDIIYKD